MAIAYDRAVIHYKGAKAATNFDISQYSNKPSSERELNHSQVYPFTFQSQPSENVPMLTPTMSAVLNQQQTIVSDLTDIIYDFSVIDMSKTFDDDGSVNGMQEDGITPGFGFTNAGTSTVDDDSTSSACRRPRLPLFKGRTCVLYQPRAKDNLAFWLHWANVFQSPSNTSTGKLLISFYSFVFVYV